jgi:hypothetical protein
MVPTFPGFTAAESLSKPTSTYRGRFSNRQHGGALLAMPIGGGSAGLQCLSDCRLNCLDRGVSSRDCNNICHRHCNPSETAGTSAVCDVVGCRLLYGTCVLFNVLSGDDCIGVLRDCLRGCL